MLECKVTKVTAQHTHSASMSRHLSVISYEGVPAGSHYFQLHLAALTHSILDRHERGGATL